MAVRLFVGNLSYDVTERELQEYFSAAGQVSFVSIPKDRETNKPRGFAFIEFSDQSGAAEAIRRFNNQPFKGRTLAINEAREREAGSRPGGPPRPYSPRPPIRTDDQIASGMPPSGERPSRNFGPDAAPRRARKGPPRGGKVKGAPKQPLREKAGGRFFGGDDEPYEDDIADDNFASQMGEDEIDEQDDEKETK